MSSQFSFAPALPLSSKLQDKHVLVLGGTSGIGFCVAALALAAGARVHISSSKPDKVARAVSQLKAGYPAAAASISGSVCDLSVSDQLEANLRGLLDRIGTPLDHIVFTAGDPLDLVQLVDMSVEAIYRVQTVRFVAPLIMAKIIAKDNNEMLNDTTDNAGGKIRLHPSPTSSITLTNGSVGYRPEKNWTLQAAFGNAMEGLVRGLSVDLAPIRVNVVRPGAVLTEIFSGLGEGPRLEAALERFKSQTTTKEVGRPEDVAEAYLYCMRDRFAVAQVVGSDGGRLIV